MKVKTLVPHTRSLEPLGSPEKKKGDVYEVADDEAKALIEDGTVEQVKKG